MAMLSLSVSCIHLELSAAKSPKEQALVLSMILFQRGRKMTELCATRMELDYAFVEFPQLSLKNISAMRAKSERKSQAQFKRARRSLAVNDGACRG
jgi:hypothetical protein